MAALFFLAREFGVKACGILVITDHPLYKAISTDNPSFNSNIKSGFVQVEKAIVGYISMGKII